MQTLTKTAEGEMIDEAGIPYAPCGYCGALDGKGRIVKKIGNDYEASMVCSNCLDSGITGKALYKAIREGLV